MFSSRLCVPISGCAPPAAGVTPSVASHHATPSASDAAAITRWSISAGAMVCFRSERDVTVDAGHGIAADPDRAVAVALDVHAARAAQALALRGQVALGHVAV